VNGQEWTAAPSRGYVDVERTWQAGDTVDLELPMPVERVHAHPGVRADVGRVCLKRGPLVYCVEEVDHPSAPVGTLRLPRNAPARALARPDLFSGTMTIVADAAAVDLAAAAGTLYRPEPFATRATTLTAIPYYLWNNRGPNRMLVWLPET
jgi:hypothetical protein